METGKLVIYDNAYNLPSQMAMQALGHSAKDAGFDVVFQNPNPFRARDEIKDAELVFLYGRGDKQALIKKIYEKMGVEVIDLTDKLLQYTVVAIQRGELLEALFEKEKPAPETPKADPEEKSTAKKSNRGKKKK